MSKFYLCTDIINPNTKRLETYYLVNEELESLLKYTSYCTDYNMLLNTLPDKVKEFTKINLSGLNNHSFYYKKTKSSDKINAIYKDDEDLVYTDSKSLIYLMFKRAIFITKGEVYNNSFDRKIEEIYKLMASLITKKELINIINYNFKLRFDSDKNLDYRYLDKCELWQKIALMKVNSDLVIKYICHNSYKKLLFTLKLKEVLNERLVGNNRLERNKKTLKNRLQRKKCDYSYINKQMEENFEKRFGSKKVSNVELLKDYEHNPYEDTDFEKEDMLYMYEKMLEEDPDNDDIRLYIDAQKEKTGYGRVY